MVRVLTVDDHAAFRAVMRDVIAATPGFESAGEATSGPEALEIATQVRAQLALVDVRMPGMDGVETARLLRTADPALVVILISLQDAASLPPSASACGAAELVRKQDFCPTLLRDLWAAHGSEPGHVSITRAG